MITNHLLAHRRLVLCALVGAAAGLGWPGLDTMLAHVLLGWNVFAWTYLATVSLALMRADRGHIKRLALAQAESAGVVLAIVTVAALISLVAVVFEVVAAKAAAPHEVLPHVAFAVVTVLGSWILLPMLYALSYASLYYGADPGGGLLIPGSPPPYEPDHTDFLYFSFSIAVALQTADISLTTRDMRRLVLVHSLVSFVFNTTILAFSINAAAGFF